MRMHVRSCVALAAICAFAGAPLTAAIAQNPSAEARPALPFDSSDVMIPMRDGVKLHTTIFVPQGSTANLPIILTRTPYGITGSSGALRSSYAELAEEGYIFVWQDIRGRFGSDGQFVMLRSPRDKRLPNAIDESTDTYDTIEWLLKNVPRNNGRVGMLGISYPGWLTVMAMLDPHPALKAVSPQASPASMFLGDDFHHNGAFRLSYGFEYVAALESGKGIRPFAFDKADVYSWYLTLGALSHVKERYPEGQYPTWLNFSGHPNFDAFWQREALMQYLDRVSVPTLTVAGWWDQEDFYGPLKIYETLESHDSLHRNYLVVGPWNHGGWAGRSGQTLGPIDFGSATAPYFRKNIQAPWFVYWLKDKGTLNLAEATTFEAGTNTWRSFDSWPPKTGVTQKSLFFASGGQLSWEKPNDAVASQAGAPRDVKPYDEYVSDPAHPVPYRPRPVLPLFGRGGTWPIWLADDQRFVADRMDVTAWETPPLTEDMTIAGKLAAHLFASTTGTDADWIVKVIDVYPENDPKLGGYEFMVANDVLRGRFRKSFEHPEAIVPNHVDEYTIDLHSQDYTFRKGHRVRVQVQSTWFPLIDRNPQTFVPNIFEAKDSDFHIATQRIWRSRGAASYVSLPVVAKQPAVVP